MGIALTGAISGRTPQQYHLVKGVVHAFIRSQGICLEITSHALLQVVAVIVINEVSEVIAIESSNDLVMKHSTDN